MFEVVVFLACRRADPEGPRGPGSLARLPYTLEGVSYTFRLSEADQEPPIHVPELWFYLRFNRTSPNGFVRRLGLRVLALDSQNNRKAVAYPFTRPAAEVFDLGKASFPGHSPVTSAPFVIRDLELPRRGRYEFRLLVKREQPTWQGSKWRAVASHYIEVE